MKLFALALVLFAQTASANGYSPAKIYAALNVEEQLLNPGIAGVSRTEKAVGGLVCQESLLFSQQTPSAACLFLSKADEDGLIYEALDIKPVVLNPGILGVSRLRKSVGGLICIREVIIYPGAKPTYNCELQK